MTSRVPGKVDSGWCLSLRDIKRGRKTERERFSFLGMKAERKLGSQQVVFFYQAGDKTGELELEPGRKSDNGLPDSLAGVASRYPGIDCFGCSICILKT